MHRTIKRLGTFIFIAGPISGIFSMDGTDMGLLIVLFSIFAGIFLRAFSYLLDYVYEIKVHLTGSDTVIPQTFDPKPVPKPVVKRALKRDPNIKD